jgi:hypothetical protein
LSFRRIQVFALFLLSVRCYAHADSSCGIFATDHPLKKSAAEFAKAQAQETLRYFELTIVDANGIKSIAKIRMFVVGEEMFSFSTVGRLEGLQYRNKDPVFKAALSVQIEAAKKQHESLGEMYVAIASNNGESSDDAKLQQLIRQHGAASSYYTEILQSLNGEVSDSDVPADKD